MLHTIDVTGIPADAVHAIEQLIEALRTVADKKQPRPRDHESWSKALHAWANSHAKRKIVIDDSRETLYAERGT